MAWQMSSSDEPPDRVGLDDRPARPQPDGLVEVAVSLILFGAAATEGTATVVVHRVGRRIGRALLTLGVCWTLAVAAVFIPLAHFVLVPGFLIGGVIFAMIRVRQTWMFQNVRGPCPRCRVEQTFVPAGRSRGEWRVDCPNCGNQVTVSPQRPPVSAPA
jgi:hypothetical protein